MSEPRVSPIIICGKQFGDGKTFVALYDDEAFLNANPSYMLVPTAFLKVFVSSWGGRCHWHPLPDSELKDMMARVDAEMIEEVEEPK